MPVAWAVKLLGEMRVAEERVWETPGWLVWANPVPLDARAGTIAWSPDRDKAQRFCSEGQAIAVMVAVMPAQYLCEVVDVGGEPDE